MEENKNLSAEHSDKEPTQPVENTPKEITTSDESVMPEAEAAAIDQQLTTHPKPQTEKMEVHHHGHVHEKKKWKEYLFQFLMLFLAVFCGFFAEYQLEHKIERDREKEFAKALYNELVADSTAASNKMTRRLEKEKDMEYLSSYFKDSSLTNLPKDVYPAYTITLYLINSYAFEPKDGILNQLRN